MVKKSHEVKMMVLFYDLDPLGIVWHGNYFKYFEVARGALFQHLGVDMYEYFQKTGYVFPIVKTSAKHILPLRYNDEFICKATLLDYRLKIIVGFEIRLEKDGKLYAKGKSEQVAVKTPEMEMQFKIPEDLKRQFKT
jgi:acyl-CoA thioester hydrolase